jgi:glycosyltransferase involved in cell wall biosynthesis
LKAAQNVEVESLPTRRKIKVLYLIDHLIGFGGTEKHLLQLVSFLNKDVFSFRIISFSDTPHAMANPKIFQNYVYLRKKFEEAGTSIINLPIQRVYAPHAIRQFFALKAAIRSFGPDIVQTFHFVPDTLGVVASRLAGAKIVISSRRDTGDLKKKRQLLANRMCNRLIDNYIAVCGAVANRIEHDEQIPKEKIKVIYNGIRVEDYIASLGSKDVIRERLGISPNAFVVGIACIFRPEKGVDVFFRGVSEARDRIKELKILAVGGGKMQKSLIELCSRLSLSADVIFTGYISDIREYVPAMDVVCLTPVRNEGFSNVILEEMAMAKPVVATDVGGNGEVVVNGITGKIIPAGDPYKIAASILELYRNKELRLAMGQRGRELVMREFALDRMIERTEAYYLSLLEEARSEALKRLVDWVLKGRVN